MHRRRGPGVTGHRHGGAGDGSRVSGPDARGVAAGIGSLALIESLGDPTLTVGLSFAAVHAKAESGEWSDVLRWSQRVIDLADGDPSKGNFIFGSPLAVAFMKRADARYCLGRPGWRDDLRHGLAMARSADPMSYATVVTYVYIAGIPSGVLRADDSAVREIEDALRIAERSGDDLAVALARMTLGVALVHRHTAAERDRGQKLLAEVSEVFLRRGYLLGELPIVNVYLARERARRGDRDDAIPLMRAAVDHLFREGRLLVWGVPATGVLVETLLDRGAEGDVAEAEAAIERLAAAPADEGLVIRDIWLLRLRRCWRGLTAMTRLTRTSGIATATWRKRLASKDISRGPRPCHDGSARRPHQIDSTAGRSNFRYVTGRHRRGRTSSSPIRQTLSRQDGRISNHDRALNTVQRPNPPGLHPRRASGTALPTPMAPNGRSRVWPRPHR